MTDVVLGSPHVLGYPGEMNAVDLITSARDEWKFHEMWKFFPLDGEMKDPFLSIFLTLDAKREASLVSEWNEWVSSLPLDPDNRITGDSQISLRTSRSPYSSHWILTAQTGHANWHPLAGRPHSAPQTAFARFGSALSEPIPKHVSVPLQAFRMLLRWTYAEVGDGNGLCAAPAREGARAAAPSVDEGPRLSNRARERIAGYLFVAPDAIGLLIFVGGPMILSLSLGFFSVSGFGEYEFVGIANYRRMMADPLFWRSVEVTVLYVVALVPSLYVVGLGLALLVQSNSRFNTVVRSLLFMPQTVSLVVVGLVWQVLLVDKIGLFNQFGATFNLQSISWLGDPRFALFTVIGISVWFLMGFYMLIFLGGLQDIPREYYEAARIDGAGAVQSFFKITLPLLQPTSFFVLLVSTVAAVCGSQTFDLIYIMTKGGPANSTSLAIFYIYQQAFLFNEYGYAAAMASVLVVVLMAITVLLFALTRGGRFTYG